MCILALQLLAQYYKCHANSRVARPSPIIAAPSVYIIYHVY